MTEFQADESVEMNDFEKQILESPITETEYEKLLKKLKLVNLLVSVVFWLK